MPPASGRLRIRYWLLSALLAAAPALAISLDEAKTQGLVGERANGYVGIVEPSDSDSDSDLRDLKERINDARRERYENIAERNDLTLDVVEKLAGKKAIEKTPSGEYVKLPDEGWRKK